MRKSVLVGAALALYLGGTVTGILFQVFFPILDQRGKKRTDGLGRAVAAPAHMRPSE
jgi:hypothetical protein